MIAPLYKSKQFFFVLIKLSIVLLAFYFIYARLANDERLELSGFFHLFTGNSRFSFNIVLTLIALSGFNWFLEILKWQSLTSNIKKLSFREAMKQTLSSLTSSILTPNRIGEYGAKALFFKSKLRKKVVFVNFIGNIMQLFATLFFGIIGFYYFLKFFESPFDLQWSMNILIGLFLTSFLVLVLIFKNRFRPFQNSIKHIKGVAKTVWLKAFLYSVIRYIIFSFQFYFLLQIFEVELSYFDSMIFISTMYLIVSIIPNVALLDVVIKGGVAIYLFSFTNIDELTILYIVTIMWLLNFAMPSILGSYYVLNYKFKNSIIHV